MGHARCGTSPDTKPWRETVGLLADGASAAAIAGATSRAAVAGFELALRDRGLSRVVFLLARRSNRVERAEEGDAAKDADVLVRRWLLVNVDPVRDAKIGTNDAEKARAAEVARAVREYLHGLGWPEPIVADSGNGYHLLYRIDLPAADGGPVKRVLESLARRFDTDGAKVDTGVFNPARICKLPGTWAKKGDPTADRPHRQGRILHAPAEIAAVDRALSEAPPEPAVVRERPLPDDSRASGRPGTGIWNRRLDVARRLTDRGFAFRRKGEPDALGRAVCVLDRCPFNPDHAHPDSCVTQDADGKLSARCLNNSCSGHGWQEFKRRSARPDDALLGHAHRSRRRI